MKFLCDQCKAKYQIADDKVAGKTVRMKCRKCGHLIEVKAEVTETSVSTQMPSPPQVGAVPLGPAAKPPVPGRPGAPAAPRAPIAPSQRPASLATSLASARPPATKPAAPPGPLANAFQKSVQKEDESLLELAATGEWYVAINGVPVGPIRIGELRRKIGTGAITEASLCWQEGMEEWRPVRSVTELAALVREVTASGRPSLVTPPPADVRPSASPPAVAARPSRTPSPARVEPSRPLAPAARSNVVAINSRLATAERFDEEDRTFVGDPFANVPADVHAALAPAPTPVFSPIEVAPAPAAPAAVNERVSAGPYRESSIATGLPRKPPPWIAIGMLVLFAAFGITAAVILFSRPPPVAAQPAVAATPSIALPAPTVTSAPTSDLGPGVHPAVSVSPDGPTGVAAGRGGGGVKPAPSAAATKAVDPSLAALIGTGPAGPSGPSGGSNGGGAGSSLSSDMIESVVRTRAPLVKRTCWERGGGTVNDVSVKVHLTIAGNGSVSNTSSSGNDPAVAKCIENAVHGWTFPATGGTTDVDIPFHFLRQ